MAVRAWGAREGVMYRGRRIVVLMVAAGAHIDFRNTTVDELVFYQYN